MPTFEDFFTPIDEIRKTEKTYGAPASPPSKEVKYRGEIASFLNKTPLQILEEGCTAAYQQKVDWIMQQHGIEFEMTCQLRGVRGVGKNVNKKIAKQNAAVDFLRKMVQKGNYKDLLIPGDNEEEANKNMDQLVDVEKSRQNGDVSPSTPVKHAVPVDDIPTSDKLTDNVDWIGKLQELLHKIRIPAASYDCLEEADATSKKFIFICSVGSQKTRGISTTKKTAKKIAALLMFTILESGIDMLDTEFLDQDDQAQDLSDTDDARRINLIEEACSKEEDAETSLKKILSDTARFSRYEMTYKFPSVSTIGFRQMLLEIDVTPVVPSDDDDLEVGAEHTQTEEIAKASAQKEKERKKVMEGGPFVFCGYGQGEEDAKRNSCQSALIYFRTYEF